jgi:hypothetical protein
MSPLVSFIVLSYNYEDLIRQTLESIQAQTVINFEVIVVDDASRDRSPEVVESFNDPRIRLFRNETNRGGAWSYNRAVSLASGEFLVNLDADDWIDPSKTEIQLREMQADPSLSVLGTYINVMDETGARHVRADELEAYVNTRLDLNRLDNWIGRNTLCRSSTMVRRNAHLQFGLDDADMVRAPDYELWTRALSKGHKIRVLPQRLTYYRLQPKGVTYADPTGTLLEMSYAMMQNLVPLAEKRGAHPSFVRILDWVCGHDNFAALPNRQRCRLVGAFVLGLRFPSYSQFLSVIGSTESDDILLLVGRRSLAMRLENPLLDEVDKLVQDVALYVEARDYWHKQSDIFERRVADLSADSRS